MTNAIDLGKVGGISNAVYNNITSNATAITAISVGATTINSSAIAVGTTTINSSAIAVGTTTINSNAIAVGGSLDVNGVIRGQATALSGDVLLIGDNTKLVDINVLDTVGLYSQSNTLIGSLKLGSNGGIISGYNGNIGIGTSSPGAMLAVTGSSSTLSTLLTNIAEPATISATAATGTINYDITTQSVLYYTSTASANWTVNFRGSAGTSSNTLMTTGQSITAVFLVTQGATAYYNNVVQVDGSTVTPKYQGGSAWTAGNINSVDIYTYTIMKTGSAAFTVFASQTKFA